jgi:uncharacterized protein Yka (UPF0111/DUF47 family)
MKGQTSLPSVITQLQHEEDEGDRVVRNALADLFDDPRIDPLMVIRWKDIHEGLEAAINSAQAVGNVPGTSSSRARRTGIEAWTTAFSS